MINGDQQALLDAAQSKRLFVLEWKLQRLTAVSTDPSGDSFWVRFRYRDHPMQRTECSNELLASYHNRGVNVLDVDLEPDGYCVRLAFTQGCPTGQLLEWELEGCA